MNLPSAVPVAKPLGSAETLSMYSRYSCLLEKSGNFTGVSFVATFDELNSRNEVVDTAEKAVPLDLRKADAGDVVNAQISALLDTRDNMAER